MCSQVAQELSKLNSCSFSGYLYSKSLGAKIGIFIGDEGSSVKQNPTMLLLPAAMFDHMQACAGGCFSA